MCNSWALAALVFSPVVVLWVQLKTDLSVKPTRSMGTGRCGRVVNGAAILNVKAPSSFLKSSFIPDMDIKGLFLFPVLYVYAFDILSANQCIRTERPSLKLFLNRKAVLLQSLDSFLPKIKILSFTQPHVVLCGTQNAKNLIHFTCN